MREGEDTAAKCAEDVEIGRFGSKCHRCGCEGSLAVESGTAYAGAGQKVCHWFQESSLASKDEEREYKPHAFRVNCGKEISCRGRSMAKATLSNPANKQQIVERLGKIQPSSARQWGRMTVNQMICHLSDSFRVTMGLKFARASRIAVAPIPLPRWFVKWVALGTSIPWPRELQTRPEVDAERGGTPPSQFDQDKAELFRLLDRFTRQPRDFELQPHPMFGNMSEGDWMRWGYLHMDHHLRQFGA